MEHQFKPWQPVIVRDADSQVWKANFFSHYVSDNEVPYRCCIGAYKQCLPAEGNEHLIGTTDSPTPPEPEFKFGDKVEVSHAFYSPIVWEKAIFMHTSTTTHKQAGKEYETIKYRVILATGTYEEHYRNEIRHADW